MSNLFYILRISTTIILLASVVFGASFNASAAEDIRFPARSSDLANDSYWAVSEFGEGCCVIDFNVQRWNGSSWAGENAGGENSDDFTWNVPLYAPANGEIAACWRNIPNNPKPGRDNRHKDYPSKIFKSGNHVTIITDQGNRIGLSHLKQGSVPAKLCPSNADSTTHPSTTMSDVNDDKEGGWHPASYIEPADRPRVKEGDFIGRAGNSGASSGPHLHLSMKKLSGKDDKFNREASTGSSFAMRFRHSWAHRYEKNSEHQAGGWFRLRGKGFSGDAACNKYRNNAPECEFKTVHPSPYLRRVDKTDAAIKSSDTLYLSSNRAVTAAVSATDSKLKLTSWDIIGTGTMSKNSGETLTAGPVKSVHLSEPASNWILAAVRLPDDRLKMMAFSVDLLGRFQRRANYTAGKVLSVDMATTRGPNRKAVTAVRLRSGVLKLIAWDLAFANNGDVSIVRLGQKSDIEVEAFAVSRASNFNGVFTVARDSDDKLKITPWKMSTDGNTFTRGTDDRGGTIGSVLDVAPLPQGVAAAVTIGDGNLRLITWSASTSGNIVERRETRDAGKVTDIQLISAIQGSPNLTTAVRANGNLVMIGWAVASDGKNLRRVGSSKAGTIKNLSADVTYKSFGNSSRDFILTSVRLANDDLKLISWDTNLHNP